MYEDSNYRSQRIARAEIVALIAPHAEFNLIATSRGPDKIFYDLPMYRYRSLDVTNLEATQRVIEQEKPDVIIHTCRPSTKVDYCEHHQDLCHRVNVTATEHVVQAALASDSRVIHLSTDFIFPGDKKLLTEDEPPGPINHYGKSKLEAERLIIASEVAHAIVRTAIVYGVVPHLSRSNIILWVKDSLKRGKTIHVVDDQYRTPTLAEDLAMGCFLIARQKAEGVFNISVKNY